MIATPVSTIVAVEQVNGSLKFLLAKHGNTLSIYTKEQVIQDIQQDKRHFVVYATGSDTPTNVVVVDNKKGGGLLAKYFTKHGKGYGCFLRTDTNKDPSDNLDNLPSITSKFE